MTALHRSPSNPCSRSRPGRHRRRCLPIALAALLAACGGEAPVDKPEAPVAPSAEAVSVTAARAQADGTAATVVGRVSRTVSGLAVLTLTDRELPYCGQDNPEDGCKTPWDYCCETAATRTAKSLLVEARGADGKPRPSDGLPAVRLLDLVEVKGTLEQDQHGNHLLLAESWRRLERPQLPADVRWPK